MTTPEREDELTIRRLSAATTYKLVFLGLLVGMVPLGLFFGILGSTGINAVRWNNEPVYGLGALIAGPVIGVFLALLFTGFLGTVISAGLWLFSFFRPLTIRIIVDVRPGTWPAMPSGQAQIGEGL